MSTFSPWWRSGRNYADFNKASVFFLCDTPLSWCWASARSSQEPGGLLTCIQPLLTCTCCPTLQVSSLILTSSESLVYKPDPPVVGVPVLTWEGLHHLTTVQHQSARHHSPRDCSLTFVLYVDMISSEFLLKYFNCSDWIFHYSSCGTWLKDKRI